MKPTLTMYLSHKLYGHFPVNKLLILSVKILTGVSFFSVSERSSQNFWPNDKIFSASK